MQIDFKRNINDPNQYFVVTDYDWQFTASFNKKTKSKELFDRSGCKVAEGYNFYERNLQFRPSFMIQSYGEHPFWVLIKNGSSFFYNTCYFTYNNNRYSTIRHIGTTFSIYNETEQVGLYITNSSDFVGCNMRLLLNNDLDHAFFSLVALGLYSDFGSESASTNYPDYWGPQKKKRDKTWKPK